MDRLQDRVKAMLIAEWLVDCMDAWLNGLIDVWLDEWMTSMDACLAGEISEWMAKCWLE